MIDQDHKEFEFSNPPILNEKKTNPNLDEEISFSCRQCYKSFEEPRFLILHISTGKSLSEALIFASTNPQYDDRLFIELQVQYMNIPSTNLGRNSCVQKLFLTFRTISVHNMIFPCSAKRRASDKDLPVQNTIMMAMLSQQKIRTEMRKTRRIRKRK